MKFEFFADVCMNCLIAQYESLLLRWGLHEIEFFIT